MRDPRKLRVWRRAINLSGDVVEAIPIRVARKSPGLRAQAIRAASGISEAIAEGCGRSTEKDFAKFIDAAIGSTTELQTQLMLARRHGILSPAKFKSLWREAGEIRRMLYSLVKTVRARV